MSKNTRPSGIIAKLITICLIGVLSVTMNQAICEPDFAEIKQAIKDCDGTKVNSLLQERSYSIAELNQLLKVAHESITQSHLLLPWLTTFISGGIAVAALYGGITLRRDLQNKPEFLQFFLRAISGAYPDLFLITVGILSACICLPCIKLSVTYYKRQAIFYTLLRTKKETLKQGNQA